jgi:hypothetical protein
VTGSRSRRPDRYQAHSKIAATAHNTVITIVTTSITAHSAAITLAARRFARARRRATRLASLVVTNARASAVFSPSVWCDTCRRRPNPVPGASPHRTSVLRLSVRSSCFIFVDCCPTALCVVSLICPRRWPGLRGRSAARLHVSAVGRRHAIVRPRIDARIGWFPDGGGASDADGMAGADVA